MAAGSASRLHGQRLREAHHCGFVLPWTEEMALESESLNHEHQALLQRLDQFLVAVDSSDPTHVMIAWGSLSAEALSHFASEEAQMRAAGYPELDKHAKQHEELHRALVRLRYSVSGAAGTLSTTAVLSFVERWFIPHVTHADRTLADYLWLVQILPLPPRSSSLPRRVARHFQRKMRS
jgi:hemerythrin-like metal-binding protein